VELILVLMRTLVSSSPLLKKSESYSADIVLSVE